MSRCVSFGCLYSLVYQRHNDLLAEGSHERDQLILNTCCSATGSRKLGRLRQQVCQSLCAVYRGPCCARQLVWMRGLPFYSFLKQGMSFQMQGMSFFLPFYSECSEDNKIILSSALSKCENYCHNATSPGQYTK